MAAIIVLLAGAGARAQTPAPAPAPERPPLGATITVDALGGLPASANLFSLLDTAVPDVIADRIDTGGISAGDPARVGAHGSTWTQTLFRVGEVEITDPGGGGVPLVAPGVDAWQRVDVYTGLNPVDVDAPGLAVTMTPRRPFDTWRHTLEFIGSPPALNAGNPEGDPLPIARLNSWFRGSVVTSGPVNKSGAASVFVAAGVTRSTHFERDGVHQIDSNVASLFTHVSTRLGAGNSVHVVGWVQRLRDPVVNHQALGQPNAGEIDRAFHGQLAWDRVKGRAATRLFAGVTTRGRTNELEAPPFVAVERMRDGPIPNLLDAGEGRDTVWHVGGRSHVSFARAGRHEIAVGLDVVGASMTQEGSFAGTVGELLNGQPARVWEFTDPPGVSDYGSLAFAGFVGDTIAVHERLTLNAGARFEALRGSRAGGGTLISYASVLPRAGLHVALFDYWKIAAFGHYGEYGYRLPLGHLAWGDPDAPTGRVYRWQAPVGTTTLAPGAVGPLVQLVGPGSGGDAAFSAIDPGLRRPTMKEAILGFEARPHPAAFVRLAAIGRREHHLVGAVNTGVPESMYTTIGIPDPGIDLIGAGDDQTLIFYNRPPSTFGADQYLLTNPDDDEGSFVGADLVGSVHAKRFYFLAGATAGRSEGLSANRGFGPLENDHSVVGEVYINPNARAHAQGRMFTERGYTIKLAAAYEFERGYTMGLVARYQDGQHFARMVIMDLNQGPEAVRAFRNGRTRFTFSSTVDGRLQKTWRVGTQPLTAFIDAYNLLNLSLEVEEFSVTGATSRLTSAVQPPRVVQIGVRLPF